MDQNNPRCDTGEFSSETSPLLHTQSNLPNDAPESIIRPQSTVSSELWLIIKYSVPLIVTYLLQYAATIITAISAGHLSSEDLGASSIAVTTINITGYTIMEGMATTLDTLCAQAYGSGRLTHVGLYVQRMILLMTVCMIPIGAIWLFSPWILPLVVNQLHLAAKAGVFLQCSLLGLPGYAFFEAGKRFLQVQGDFKGGTLVLLICTPAAALLSWLFAFKLEMGLPGAALAQAAANILRSLLLLLYILIFCPWSLKCWGGWSRQAFRSWGTAVKLSAASTAVNVAEWLSFEILTVSTSYLDTNHLAAQTILTTLSIISWHVPFSVSVAVSTRMGTIIGGGFIQLARREAKLSTFIFLGIGIFNCLLMFLLRGKLPALFSNDPEVIKLARQSMLSVALYQIVDAVPSGCNGLLRGLGHQSVAAWVVLAVNYTTAVPMAMWLELGKPQLGLDGIWIGLGTGLLLIAIIEYLYLRWMNWEACYVDIQVREEEEVEN